MENRVSFDSTPPSETNGQSITGLISGILDDGQRLFRQQVEMVRAEMRADLRKTKESALYLGIGVGIAALGIILLCVALVYLLQDLAAPNLPLWACWASVGGSLLLLGGIAFFVGYRILSRNNPLPDKSFNALQESVSWIVNRRS